MKGKFYGIGVGPGDPELLTLKAIRILKNIDIVISPETKKGKGSIALDIAKDYLRDDIEKLNLIFPMTYDEKVLNEKWKENAEIINLKLEEGKNIAFLTLGDPMVFSTYMYLIPPLRKQGVDIETIPGITSFCAVASTVEVPLSAGEESLCILPLRRDCENLDEVLDSFDNIVVMKPSHDNKLLGEKLIERGYGDKFVLVSKCGTSEEEVSYDIDRLKDKDVPYLSTVIIKKRGIR